jgi:curved DNA-binding protein CbpA
MIKDYYQELHVHPKAVPELINSSYKILKEKYQRDIHPDELESWMKGLDEAYQILSNTEKRKKYDQVYYQEFGGIAELEKKLNRHKGLLIALSSVFVILIVIAVYFLYTLTVGPPDDFRKLVIQQAKVLQQDLETYKKDNTKYPSVTSPEALRKALEKCKKEREDFFWSMVNYKESKSGSYRIRIDMGETSLIVTPESVLN